MPIARITSIGGDLYHVHVFEEGGHPDHGLPGGGNFPGHLPSEPPPQIMPGQTLIMVRDQYGTWYYASIPNSSAPPRPGPPMHPDQGLPGQPAHPDQGLPGQGRPPHVGNRPPGSGPGMPPPRPGQPLPPQRPGMPPRPDQGLPPQRPGMPPTAGQLPGAPGTPPTTPDQGLPPTTEPAPV